MQQIITTHPNKKKQNIGANSGEQRMNLQYRNEITQKW